MAHARVRNELEASRRTTRKAERMEEEVRRRVKDEKSKKEGRRNDERGREGGKKNEEERRGEGEEGRKKCLTRAMHNGERRNPLAGVA